MTAEIDNRIEIVTPENIAFHYRAAGPFQRLPAYLIDVLLRVTVLGIGAAVVGFVFGAIDLAEAAAGFLLVAYFLLEWFYGGFFETVWNGQTPGKWLLRLRVVSITGQPITGSQAVLRNLLRAADAMPALPLALFQLPSYQLGLLTMSANARFQRLGDFASGTMVVVEEPQRRHGVVIVNEPEVVRLAQSLPPKLQLSPSAARTLSAYVARRNMLSPARRVEISRHLAEPLRQRLGLPPVNPDLLLCAIYRRTFLAEVDEERAPRVEVVEAPLEIEGAVT